MEINVNVTFDASDRLFGVLERLAVRPEPRVITTAVPAKDVEAMAKTVEQELARQEAPAAAKTEPASKPAPEPAPVVPATADPAPVYNEKPSDVLPLLCQRFGIPEDRTQRTPEQRAMATALNKCVRSLIRELSKNPSAKAITDIPDDKVEDFIRIALEISYNNKNNEFVWLPF